MYSCTLSLTSALNWDGCSKPPPRPLYSREGPITHCIGGWADPRAGLDWCGKSLSHRDYIPGPCSLQRDSISTTLTRTTQRLVVWQENFTLDLVEVGCRICSVLSRIRFLSYVEIQHGLWRTESELCPALVKSVLTFWLFYNRVKLRPSSLRPARHLAFIQRPIISVCLSTSGKHSDIYLKCSSLFPAEFRHISIALSSFILLPIGIHLCYSLTN